MQVVVVADDGVTSARYPLRITRLPSSAAAALAPGGWAPAAAVSEASMSGSSRGEGGTSWGVEPLADLVKKGEKKGAGACVSARDAWAPPAHPAAAAHRGASVPLLAQGGPPPLRDSLAAPPAQLDGPRPWSTAASAPCARPARRRRGRNPPPARPAPPAPMPTRGAPRTASTASRGPLRQQVRCVAPEWMVRASAWSAASPPLRTLAPAVSSALCRMCPSNTTSGVDGAAACERLAGGGTDLSRR